MSESFADIIVKCPHTTTPITGKYTFRSTPWRQTPQKAINPKRELIQHARTAEEQIPPKAWQGNGD